MSPFDKDSALPTPKRISARFVQNSMLGDGEEAVVTDFESSKETGPNGSSLKDRLNKNEIDSDKDIPIPKISKRKRARSSDANESQPMKRARSSGSDAHNEEALATKSAPKTQLPDQVTTINIEPVSGVRTRRIRASLRADNSQGELPIATPTTAKPALTKPQETIIRAKAPASKAGKKSKPEAPPQAAKKTQPEAPYLGQPLFCCPSLNEVDEACLHKCSNETCLQRAPLLYLAHELKCFMYDIPIATPELLAHREYMIQVTKHIPDTIQTAISISRVKPASIKPSNASQSEGEVGWISDLAFATALGRVFVQSDTGVKNRMGCILRDPHESIWAEVPPSLYGGDGAKIERFQRMDEGVVEFACEHHREEKWICIYWKRVNAEV